MAQFSEVPASKRQISVVLFSGGSGTKNITDVLARHPQIALTVLINAYDDGHSTGRLRRFIPSMLGPSDVRKNVIRLMPKEERCHRSLQKLSEFRLPPEIPRGEALRLLENIAAGKIDDLPGAIQEPLEWLSLNQYRQMCSLLGAFLEYHARKESSGHTFDFGDCALGNLFFAGCFLLEGEDFNRATESFCRFCHVRPDAVLNITTGENLYLVAIKEDGAVLWSEADIVSTQSPARITDLYLLEANTYREVLSRRHEEPPAGWRHWFQQAHHAPQINPAARRAIEEADVIIYGPGTQHSSLLPSYLTRGIAEAIAANRAADKIFIGNIAKDHDIQQEDAIDITNKFLQAMSRNGEYPVTWSEVVTHFFFQRHQTSNQDSKDYVIFDPARFPFPQARLRLRDWETERGKHAGGLILDEVREIIQARIDIKLQPLPHMVSIIVPVLNEEKTLGRVLRSLTALDFQPLGLGKEILVVDGGSTDASLEIARSAPNVRVFAVEGQRGLGASLRLGIENARGNIIAFFPADDEYSPADLYSLVRPLMQGEFRAVFGTRAVKCKSLSEQLRKIYQNQTLLYLISKYGGILLSTATLLLYNRYVTDVLSSLKAFDAALLKSLNLSSVGRGIDTEIVAKLALRQEFILEVPVDYKPRTRAQGKKIGLQDGLAALLVLFRYRFAY